VLPVVAIAPGRVNLIGDHTDTSGGWCLPMAIDLVTTVRGVRGGNRVVLRSDSHPDPAVVPLDIDDASGVTPAWARYVAGVVTELRPSSGFTGVVTSTLPAGAGLSSSAALEIGVALALGFAGDPRQLALLCQRAERRATGVPCGVMDQMASIFGADGNALLLDCTSLAVDPIPIPPDVDVIVVDSGQARQLAGSPYAQRRRQVEAAARIVGPLRDAVVADLSAIGDAVLSRRARHVVTENQRVHQFAAALFAGDVASAGALMTDSHASLRDDFSVSTPALDTLVERLVATPGVFGARLTGAGFGGCVVALCRPGAVEPSRAAWRFRPSAGARCQGRPIALPAP
jgi:galactokinase